LLALFSGKVELPQEDEFIGMHAGLIESLFKNQGKLAALLSTKPAMMESKIMASEVSTAIQKEMIEAMLTDDELFKNNLEAAVKITVDSDALPECYMIGCNEPDLIVASESGVTEMVVDKNTSLRKSAEILNKKVTFIKEIGGCIYMQTFDDLSLVVYSKIGQRVMKTFPGEKSAKVTLAPNFRIGQPDEMQESVVWYKGGLGVSFYNTEDLSDPTPSHNFIAEGSEVRQIVMINNPKKVIALVVSKGTEALMVLDPAKNKSKTYILKAIYDNSDEKNPKESVGSLCVISA
jgi:hypothetical protein